MGPHHLLDPIMGGLSADPGEKRGPRKDVERCISRTEYDQSLLRSRDFGRTIAVALHL